MTPKRTRKEFQLEENFDNTEEKGKYSIVHPEQTPSVEVEASLH